MKSDRGARSSQPRCSLQESDWVSLMNQHVATSHKIKASIVTKGFGCPFLKHNLPKSGAVSALPSLRYDRRIRVNPNNRTIRSDKLSRQDGNIACAGAHVQNAHTGPD